MKKKQLKLAKVVNVLGNMRKNPEILAYLIGSWPGAPQVYIINNDVSHLSSFCCLASYHPPGVADNSSLKKPRRFFAGFINHPLIVFSTLSPQSRQQQLAASYAICIAFCQYPQPPTKIYTGFEISALKIGTLGNLDFKPFFNGDSIFHCLFSD